MYLHVPKYILQEIACAYTLLLFLFELCKELDMAIGRSTATRRLFVGCMGAIYVCAFASLYTQVPGKYGVVRA